MLDVGLRAALALVDGAQAAAAQQAFYQRGIETLDVLRSVAIASTVAGFAEAIMPRGASTGREALFVGDELIGTEVPGKDVRVIVGGTSEGASAFFSRVAAGAKIEPHPGVDGGLLGRLPDGGAIGFRPVSGSGEPTVDVNAWGLLLKFKFGRR